MEGEVGDESAVSAMRTDDEDEENTSNLDEEEDENTQEEDSEPRTDTEGPVGNKQGQRAMIDVASKVFKKATGSKKEKLRTSESAPNVSALGLATSFSRTTTNLAFSSEYPPIPAGAPAGFLCRVFTMLHKYPVFYYVVDTKLKRMYEFKDRPVGSLQEPRSVISLHNARLEEVLQRDPSLKQNLYCWRLFLRSDSNEGTNKSFVFGVEELSQGRSWVEAIRSAFGPFINFESDEVATSGQNEGTGLKADSRANSVSTHNSADGRNSPSFPAAQSENGAGNFSPPVSPVGSSSWKQDVLILGSMYHIPCSEMSTNAWLLSEAIRAYIRRHGEEPNPELTGLYNVSQHRLVDLSEDVVKSVNLGDVLEAICTSPAPIKGSFPSTNLTGRTMTSPNRAGKSKVQRRRSVASTSSGIQRPGRRSSGISPGEAPTLSEMISLDRFRAMLGNSEHFLDHSPDQESSFLRELELLCNASSGEVPFWPPEPWSLTSNVNGINTYLSRSVDFPGVLGVATTGASPTSVLERLLDVSSYGEWNPFISNARYLEMSPSGDVVFLESKQMLFREARTPFLFGRDFCISRCWFKLEDGTHVLLFIPSEHPCCPENASFPPRWKGSLAGAYVIRPLRNGLLGEDGCVIYSHLQVDLRTALASDLIGKRVATVLTGSLAGLCEVTSLD